MGSGPVTGEGAGKRAGTTHKRVRPETAAHKRARRSRIAYREPLIHTYDAPKPKGARFDEDAADHAVKWIETELRHFKGRWSGQRLLLMKWEIKLIRHVFGWKRRDGTRLIRTVYLEVPRKAGKSTLASAIGLYLAFGDGEPAPEIVFAAFDKDQARICYDGARHMVEASPDLHARSVIYNSTKEMLLSDNPGGILKALSNESAKQYGLNLHGLIFDELMTQKTRTLWDALTTSMGSREQPLTVAISTAGWERLSVCFEQHELTESIADGLVEDPAFLGVIYGAAIDADWTDPKIWKQANPSLGETVRADYYAERCARAEAQPTAQNAFRTLLLSQWVGQERRFIDMECWPANEDEPDPPAKIAAFGGIDLSSTTDLTAFSILAERDGKLDWHVRCYLPAEGIVDRERLDRVPYRVWADQGYLTLIPGTTIDQAAVRADVEAFAEAMDLRDVGYDPWNASQIVVDLERAGVEMVKVRQGFASMSAPTKAFATRVLDGGFRTGGNPILRWTASNVAALFDAAGNVKPDKANSAHRIDPIVSGIIALDGYERRGRELARESVYKRRRLVVA